MKRTSFLLVLLSIVGCIIHANADSNKITWIHADFPVATILRGPYAGKGTCDRLEQLISKELPEFTYISQVANYDRIIVELREQQPVLCACLVKTKEREKFIEFSEIAELSLPNGVILYKTEYKKFEPYIDKDGKVDLEKLIKDSDLKLGYARGRAFDGIIDQLITANAEHPNLYGRSGIDEFQGLVEMMQHHRVDYIIGFPQEAIHFGPKEMAKKELMFLPVQGMTDYMAVHIGAPKNEWGKKIIAKINKIILKKRYTPEVLGYYDYWVDENSIRFHHKIAKELFGK